jgi:hypothetical protein
MFDRTRALRFLLLLGLFVILYGARAIAADAAWHVGKSSGDVWLTGAGVQEVSLTSDTTLKPGDSIRTGQNGRVLLVRGEETILISPSSVVGIPTQARPGLSTTIIQQAGSILLEVEKRNVKHFEVQTPYFAAVVKGTQFRVSVEKNDGHVDVLRGQVEVADFKSGQYALVLPGQVAKVAAQGLGGLSLSGAGALNPIKKGEPRAPSVRFLPVTEAALTAPGEAPRAQQVARAEPASAPLPAPPAQVSSEPVRGPSLSGPGHREETGLPAAYNSPPGHKDETGLPAAYNSSPGHKDESGPPTSRHAAAPVDAPSLLRPTRMAFEDNAGQNSSRSYDFSGWGGGAPSPSDHPRNRKQDIALDLALSSSIGAFVAFAVGMQRWRRRRKLT